MSEFPVTPGALGAEQLTRYLHDSSCLPAGRVVSVEHKLMHRKNGR
ncbi:MAG: hypothetical protein KDI09_09810 [Halioglobus sp.]|nr:hypothetical protein [Halioglobus sp.]